MGDAAQVGKTSVTRRMRVVLLALAAPALVALVAQGAVAQTARPVAQRSHTGGRGVPRKAAPDGGAASTSNAGTLTAAPAAGPTATVSSGDAGAGVVESRTLDGGTHVFKFSELDIEGRLKSPQLVYFLRRVRAEFSAGELGHRTFMREMSETRKESTF
ncbi:MAG TPA: hypothetical protein VGL81_19785 [Polyangiaceae bacterium]|jgi:hypothetical protein